MKTILTIWSLLLGGLALADTDRFITGITVKNLYVFDDEAKELGQVKAAAVRKEFKEFEIDGKGGLGLRIEDENEEEGLVQVSLKTYPDSLVWVETMAVKIEPSNKLECPKVTTSEEDIARLGMTIGFGEHCKEDNGSESEESSQQSAK